MDRVKDICETMLRVSEKADMLYEAYEKQTAENEELKTLLQKEKEETQQLQLQLQAVSEELTEVKHNEGLQQLSSSVSQSTPKVNSVDFSSVSSHDVIQLEVWRYQSQVPAWGSSPRWVIEEEDLAFVAKA